MIQKYYNPLNEKKIEQGYERRNRNDKHKEYRDNHKEEAKEYHKGYMDLEKSKKRNLNKARNNIMKRNKFNILGKTKQHLRECEVRNCQNKGGRGIINHVRMLTMWKRKMNNR